MKKNKKDDSEIIDSDDDKIMNSGDEKDDLKEDIIEDTEDSNEDETDEEAEEAEEKEEVDDEAMDVADDDKEKIIDESCIYQYANDESDEEEYESEYEEDLNESTTILTEKMTKPFITKYERVTLIGNRTKQLASGAKPMIKNSKGLSLKKIAELELKEKVMPLYVERPLPNGNKEIWKVSEFVNL